MILARTILTAVLITVLSIPMSTAAVPQNPAPASLNLDFTILSDTHGYDFAPYMNSLLIRLRGTWSAATTSGLKSDDKGRVVIQFNLARDGKVHDASVVSGSGIAAVDNAAQSALAKADPFQKLPANFTGDQLHMRVSFYYNVKP